MTNTDMKKKTSCFTIYTSIVAAFALIVSPYVRSFPFNSFLDGFSRAHMPEKKKKKNEKEREDLGLGCNLFSVFFFITIIAVNM